MLILNGLKLPTSSVSRVDSSNYIRPGIRASRFVQFAGSVFFLGLCAARAGTVSVPNYSFESPLVPQVSPYAGPDMDDWQKSAQPAWYDPTNNSNTPWDYLMGTFYNVPFPGTFIDNCDGNQACFLFAVPEVAIFQDYNSIGGTNTAPTHAFNARFNPGSSYDLTVGFIGGGAGMQQGVTLQMSLYYRDAASNMVTVAATTVTNTTANFPNNTNLVDFQVHLPSVKSTDAWAGQNIGIQLLSTADFVSAGGYWDIDNVRLIETPFALSSPVLTNGHFSFTILSQPGAVVEVLAATNLLTAPSNWLSLGIFTNSTGVLPFTDTGANSTERYYRSRQL